MTLHPFREVKPKWTNWDKGGSSVWKRIGVNSEFHIPIPILWNWFLECPNSNSSSGIVASTPIPTQWNWGDSTGIPISKFPTLCSPLKRRKRQLETPSLLLLSNFFSFSKGYRVWEILKSESQWNLPNSVESELELQLQFQVWNWNGGSIQFQNSPMELELELTELFQTLYYLHSKMVIPFLEFGIFWESLFTFLLIQIAL